MKHTIEKAEVDLNVDVELNNTVQDLNSLVQQVADAAIQVIGFYMLADTARHIFKNWADR